MASSNSRPTGHGSRSSGRGAALLSLLATVGALAPAYAGRLSPELRGPSAATGASQRVIVTAASTASMADMIAAIKARGGVVKSKLPIISGTVAMVPTGSLSALSSDASVGAVEPDDPVKPSMDLVTQAVGANSVWQNPGLTGQGVTIAVVDSGIERRQDLRGRITGWIDLVGGKPNPYDDYGHGTHVAGIIAGDGHASSHPYDTRPQVGMAPEARVVGVKVLDGSGAGTVSTVIAGIDWCVQHRKAYGIRIINLSLGHRPTESYQYDPLCQACEEATKSGLLVVGAAGNAGSLGFQTIDSPANDPTVLTVGSMDIDGTGVVSNYRVSSYSGRGPSLYDHVVKPDIVAPGNRVVSLLAPDSYLPTTYPQLVTPTTYYSKHSNGPAEYMTLSGTSMAAAVGSGAAALLFQQDPSQTPGLVKARLMVSATKLAHNLRGVLSTGAGFLNVTKAVATSEPQNVPAGAMALSPLLSKLGDGGSIMVGNGAGSMWLYNLIWGSNAFWGDDTAAMNAFWGDDTAAQNAFWGDTAAMNAFWGDDVNAYGAPLIWGSAPSATDGGTITATNAFWGDNAVWSSSTSANNAFWGDDAPAYNPNTAGPSLSASNAFWGDNLVATPGSSGVSASNAFWGDDSDAS